MFRQILAGAAAGAAGTTALNTAAYADMAWRGRPSSDTPQQTVEALAARTGLSVPGSGDERANRLSGLGALAGIATGVLIGAAYGAVRSLGVRPPLAVSGLLTGAAAMAVNDAGMTALGVTDPRTWSRTDWVADAVPHLAFGVVTAATYEATAR
jgi:hypothetical protein